MSSRAAVASAGASTPIPDHSLVRIIGQGSYGEVWLARSALGRYRAVKIVFRNTFTQERPYEREFSGTQKFEPVSRTHEGLVDILQVGRNDEAGYFYYVMELADDAGLGTGGSTPDAVARHPVSNCQHPESYIPRTLAHDVSARGRLPVDECLHLGLALTSALAHLHQHGLIHRDIKPSNIIFVDGAPKLADIGTVADVAEARSYVGTQGFMPPEGPGTMQADIYSLGKVLYEISTGKDRRDYPELPTSLGDADNPRELLDLNEIILNACRADPRRRYQSAAEMHADLRLLQSGRPIKHLRKLERRLALLNKAGITVTIVALLAIGAYVGSLRQIHRARAAERQARESVSLLQLQKAEDLLRDDRSSDALAHLAHLVRNDPSNRVAAARLLSALTWRCFALPVAEPIHPEGRADDVSFSADAREILTASGDGVVQFWDARTGALRGEIPRFHGRIHSAEFSADGRRSLIVSSNFAVIWDRQANQALAPRLEHPAQVSHARFSPEERRVLTACADGTARIWDACTAEPLAGPLRHQAAVHDAVFSPDGQRVATASWDGTARIWDAQTGQPLTAPLRHDDRVNRAMFSPDGSRLVTAAEDGTARIWQASTGKRLAVLRHESDVFSAQFSPDGEKIVTASEDMTAVIWNAFTGQALGPPLRHGSWVRFAQFSPEGRRVMTASDDNTLRIWDATTGRPLSEPMRHTRDVTLARFSPDGQRLVSAVKDKTVWIWQAVSSEARSLPLLRSPSVSEARFSPTGRMVAAACRDNAVRLWDTTGLFPAQETLPQEAAVQGLRFSPDGRSLVVICSNHTARVWDVTTRQPRSAPLVHAAPIQSAEFSPDGRQVVTASEDRTARIWDAAEGRPMGPALRHSNQVLCAQFSPDGQFVLTSTRDGTAQIWEARTARRLLSLPHGHAVLHAEFSRDGERVVTASVDRTARVWSARTGEPIGSILAHDNDVLAAHFSPDGQRVVTASLDRTARIWDARTGQPLSESLLHEGVVRSAQFSPDGQQVVTGSDDGTVRLWDARTGLALADPFRAASAVRQVEFAPDGGFILMVPSQGEIQVYEVPTTVLPAPLWLADLAEAVGGKRLIMPNLLEPVPPAQFFKLKQRLAAGPPSDYYARWAKWFFADPGTRTVSPASALTKAEYVQGRIEQNTLESLQEAVRLSPTNALAQARLARQLLAQDPPQNPQQTGEADWHSRRAMELSPNEPEVSEVPTRVAERIARLVKP